MRISDWSSDVCSSDLVIGLAAVVFRLDQQARFDERGHAIAVERRFEACAAVGRIAERERRDRGRAQATALQIGARIDAARACKFILIPSGGGGHDIRSEEHTSELQSLMRISYAVF